MNYPFQAPLYAIALGDTTPRKDLLISNLTHNDLAFLGNTFLLKSADSHNFAKEKKYNLQLPKNKNNYIMKK